VTFFFYPIIYDFLFFQRAFMKSTLYFGWGLLGLFVLPLLLTLPSCAENPQIVENRHKVETFIRLDRFLKRWDRLQFKGEYHQERELKKQIQTLVDENYLLLIEELSGKNTDYRAISAQALGFSDHPQCYGALVHALKDPNTAVSVNAGNSLIRLGYAQVPLDPLKKMLESSEYPVRLVAVQILGNLKTPKAIPLLMTVLKDPHPDVALQATRALGKIGEESAIDSLLQQSLFDNNADIRAAAAQALGLIPSNRTVLPLIETLKDPVPEVQRSAWVSLQKITRKFFPIDYKTWKDWHEDESSFEKRRQEYYKKPSSYSSEPQTYFPPSHSDNNTPTYSPPTENQPEKHGPHQIQRDTDEYEDF
jgi:hypothetical protein